MEESKIINLSDYYVHKEKPKNKSMRECKRCKIFYSTNMYDMCPLCKYHDFVEDIGLVRRKEKVKC